MLEEDLVDSSADPMAAIELNSIELRDNLGAELVPIISRKVQP